MIKMKQRGGSLRHKHKFNHLKTMRYIISNNSTPQKAPQQGKKVFLFPPRYIVGGVKNYKQLG